MLKQCFLLILIPFLLAGCFHHAQIAPPPSLVVVKNCKQYRKIDAFTQVDVKGRVNIHLHTGYKKPQILLTGDARDLAQVKVFVANGILFVDLGSGYPQYGAVSADIRGPVLNRFSYVGAGIIKGNQLNTRYLELYLANQGSTDLGGNIGLQRLEIVGNGTTRITGITSYDLQVTIKGNPKVQLVGVASISKMNIDGNAWLSFYWLKGNQLTLRATGASKIQLAGRVNRLDVELWDKACFKGRYLRAQRSFVKTHNHAVAEISTFNHQSNLATDQSNIYYYYIPNTRADFMAFNGSVLNMREWDPYDFRDFTRYNKQFP